MAKADKTSIAGNVATYLVLLGVAPVIICIVDGVITLFLTAIHWFKTGAWVSLDTWSGLSKWIGPERPSFGWVVPNQLLQGYLDGARWFWMPVTGLVIFGAELLTVIGLAIGWERLTHRWNQRHERPIITLTKRQKVALGATALWVVGFPTLVATLIVNKSPTDRFWDVWGDMLGVGIMLIFWGWVLFGWTTGSKKRQA